MYVLFYKAPGTFLDRVIRGVTRSPYSHCELLFSDGAIFGIAASYKARFTSEPGLWDPKVWDCVGIRGCDEAKARSFCESQVGTSYDWKGVLLAAALPWGIESSDKWFCSEITIASLQAGGYSGVRGMKPYQYSPKRFFKHLVVDANERVIPHSTQVLG